MQQSFECSALQKDWQKKYLLDLEKTLIVLRDNHSKVLLGLLLSSFHV